MSDELLERIRGAIGTHGLLPPGSRVVAAVSGGLDSVALVDLLDRLRAESRWTLIVAHLDHGLREASREDAEFVRALAARYHLPSVIERRDVRAVCEREGWSLEDGARRVRYAFFADVAGRQGADRIALAHTADDQAETVLMRLLRGTGLLGLGAIPVTRELDGAAGGEGIRLVRPLLEVWRRDLAAHIERAGLAYREDATNADPRFVRNRIRRELLPLLERDYNPNIKGVLAQLAEQSRWDYAYLQQAADRQWRRLTRAAAPAAVAISIERFRRLPKALQRQLVRRVIQQLRGDLTRFEFRHWVEIERLVTERPAGSLLDLPGGVQLRREAHRVLCRLVEQPEAVPAPD